MSTTKVSVKTVVSTSTTASATQKSGTNEVCQCCGLPVLYCKCYGGEAYGWGFRNGYLDSILGIRLVVSLNSNIPGYSSGYHDGQRRKNENR